MHAFLHDLTPWLFVVVWLLELYRLRTMRHVGKHCPIIASNRERGLGWWRSYTKRADDIVDGVYGSRVQRRYMIAGLVEAIMLVPIAACVLTDLSVWLFN